MQTLNRLLERLRKTFHRLIVLDGKEPTAHSYRAHKHNGSHPDHPYSWSHVPTELLTLFSDRIDASVKYEFMTEAIEEAEKSGLVPTVGAIIVKDGEIIGRGHRKTEKIREAPPFWRITHAEQAALQSAERALRGATLYVTLEPCAGRYHGPTVEDAEVCSVIIPRAGISTVVIGLVDQDPMTRGKGLKRLNKAGVQLEYAYAGLEHRLVALIGDGEFGTLRPRYLTALWQWLNALR